MSHKSQPHVDFPADYADAASPLPKDTDYVEKVAIFNAHHVCDKIEHMLGPAYKDCRQSRRKFKRTVEKHWPLKPDAKRHPRTTLFVSRYEAMIKEAQEKAK